MAVSVLQSPGNKRTASGATVIVTLSTTTTGSVLVVCSSAFNSITSISGGGVTTWTPILAFSGDANHNNSDIWYGTVDTTPTTTVTVTYVAAVTWAGVVVYELAGAQKANENSVAFANDAAATTDSKVITTTTDGDIIISVVGVTGGGGAATIPTGYTTATGSPQANVGNLTAAASLIQTSHGASTMNWAGLGAGSFPSLGAVAIKAAGGAAAFTPANDQVTLNAVRTAATW